MKRSTQIMIAAMAMFVTFATPLIWLVPALVGSFRGAAHERNHEVIGVYVHESIPTYALAALLCFWGLLTAAGLVLGRPRARTSAVALSIVTLVVASLSAASFVLFAISEGGGLGIALALSCPLLLPLWWLVLFTRPSVKRQFAMSKGTSAEGGAT